MDILLRFGFQSFSPTIPDDFVDDSRVGEAQTPCMQPDGGAYAVALIEQVKRLVALPDEAWAAALEAAAHNQRHMVCGGFSAHIRQHQRNVLRACASLDPRTCPAPMIAPLCP